MIPFDAVKVLRESLAKNRRPPDGLLHCSSDLLGSLRHAQLSIAGAPKNESELVNDIRLDTGTYWHRKFNQLLIDEGLTVMHEVRVSKWLPEGWSGTADWLIWDADKRAFVLDDLKTIKGEGLYYIEKDGAKKEHIAQVSAYYHALAAARFPLVKGFGILYLPMNTDSDGRVANVEPTLVECQPLPKDQLWPMMEEKWAKTKVYLDSYNESYSIGRDARDSSTMNPDLNDFLTEDLEPPMPREQKLVWNTQRSVWDVKLVPHWSARYCPFSNELCDCSEQGTTKIGEWRIGNNALGRELLYEARNGFENVFPLHRPNDKEVARRAA